MHIPRVRIEIDTPSIYELRKQMKDIGLCTHEAIAHTLGVIEGPEVKDQLIKNLEIMNHAHMLCKPVSSLTKEQISKHYK